MHPDFEDLMEEANSELKHARHLHRDNENATGDVIDALTAVMRAVLVLAEHSTMPREAQID